MTVEEDFLLVKKSARKRENGCFRVAVPESFASFVEVYCSFSEPATGDGLLHVVFRSLPVKRGDKHFGRGLAARVSIARNFLEPLGVDDVTCSPVEFELGEAGFAMRQIVGIVVDGHQVSRGGVLRLRLDVGLTAAIGSPVCDNCAGAEEMISRVTGLNWGGGRSDINSHVKPAVVDDAVCELFEQGGFSMADFSVFDGYYRFSAKARAECESIVSLGARLLQDDSPQRRNLLIWSQSGMGKTSLIRQVSSRLGLDVSLCEIDISTVNRESRLTDFLEEVKEKKGLRIVLFDEADAPLKGEDVVYRILMPFLGAPSAGADRFLNVLIASSGGGVDQVRANMLARFKGADTLGRIGEWNTREIPAASLGDRILAFCGGALAGRRERLFSAESVLIAGMKVTDMRTAAELGKRAAMRASVRERLVVNAIDVVDDDNELASAQQTLGPSFVTWLRSKDLLVTLK